MPASILFNQTGAPAGVAGRARSDFVVGQIVSCTNDPLLAAPTSYAWELVDVPIRSALVRGTTGVGATFQFTPDVKGTYLVRLTINGSTFATDTDRSFCAILSTDLAWRYKAAGETTEDNMIYGGLGFPGDINTRGWATAEDLADEDIESAVSQVSNAVVVSPGAGDSLLVKLDSATGFLDPSVIPGGGGGGASPDKIFNVIDTSEWTEFPAPGETDAVRYAVAWSTDAELFVALTSNVPSSVIFSSDGVKWLPGTLPSTASTEQWRAIAYAPALALCAVGNAVSSGFEVITSTDGITWTSQAAATPGNDWSGLAYSDDLGLFVAVGAGNGVGENIMTSPDGVTWTTRAEPAGFIGTELWSSIVWAPPSIPVPTGQFMAVSKGGTGRTMKSVNGTTWVQAGTLSDINASGIAWNGDVFAVATDSGIFTSTNGTTWTLSTSSTLIPGFVTYFTVTWVEELGFFLATGDIDSVLAISEDGDTWYPRVLRASGGNVVVGMAWSPLLRAFAAGGNGMHASMLVSRPFRPQNTYEQQWVTTNATSTDIVLDFTHAANTVIYGRVVVVAIDRTGGDYATFEFRCVFISNGSDVLDGELPVQLTYTQQSGGPWLCELFRDTSSFLITVEGAAATRIEWKAVYEVISHG